MKHFFLLIFLFVIKISFSQSKKEQIEILTNRVDSLSLLLNKENDDYLKNEKEFKSKISNFEKQIFMLDSTLIKLNQELALRQIDINSSKKSVIDKSMEIKNLEDQILEKEKTIKLLSSEIDNLKLNIELSGEQMIEEEITNSDPNDENVYFNKDNSVNNKTEIWQKTDNYELHRLMGPEGCDATSLFKDSKGTLWLGTGSSGGVYKYDNQNKKWIETNNGLGPVHISQILEIDNILITEFLSNEDISLNSEKVEKNYRYLKGDKWLDFEENQIGLIQSQIQNLENEKKKKLIDFEIKNRNRLLKIKLDYLFLNSMEIIDNVLFLLDKRGLFYIQNSDNTIRKFNSNGLYASDIYQLIPSDNEKLYLWTNSFQLWELSHVGFRNLGELNYDFAIPEETMSMKMFLEEEDEFLKRRNEVLRNAPSFMSQGHLTLSKEKFLLCITGKLFELDKNKKIFFEKLSARHLNPHEDNGSLVSTDNEYILNGDNYYKCIIKEALYDTDGSLVFTIKNGNEDYYYPVRKVSSVYTPYKDIHLTNNPSIVLNSNGRVFGYNMEFKLNKFETIENFIPLSLSVDNAKNKFLDKAFECGLFNSNKGWVFKKSLAHGNIQITDVFERGCGDYAVHEYYQIEPLKSINAKYTCFYDDQKGNLYIGTAGSGLLNVKYKISNPIEYNSVQIGSQTWMLDNLNITTFRTGEKIPMAKNNEEWRLAIENKQPAWCYHNFDNNYSSKDRILYNGYAVIDPRGLAPIGWHIPTIEEWKIITDQNSSYLKLNPVGKMSSFAYRNDYTDVNDNPNFGYWWSNSYVNDELFNCIYIDNTNPSKLVIEEEDIGNGFSIRCVRD